jgi:hypothetical protein
MRAKVLAAALLGISTVTPAMAGPFGIDVEGFSLDKYSCIDAGGQYYACTSIPKAHDYFESYLVRYHPDAGLCSISGIGKAIEENGFGTGTISKTDELHNQISQKYGRVKRQDILLSTSIWNEPDEWLMGLSQQERSYAYIGDVSPAVEEIAKYSVIAAASSSDTGFVVVDFRTVNFDKCETAKTKDGAASF